MEILNLSTPPGGNSGDADKKAAAADPPARPKVEQKFEFLAGMTPKEPDMHATRRTQTYGMLTMGCVGLILLLLIVPTTRQILADRLSDVSHALTKASPTVQNTTMDNEHHSPAVAAGNTTGSSPLGPFALTPPVPNGKKSPSPAAPESTPVILLPNSEPVRIPADQAPASRPAAAASSPTPSRATAQPHPARANPEASRTPTGPERQAYQYLLETRPSFARLISESSDEFRYQNYSATAKAEGIYVLDFTFRKGSGEDLIHYIWEVDSANKVIRPIGLNAVKFDRLQLKRGDNG